MIVAAHWRPPITVARDFVTCLSNKSLRQQLRGVCLPETQKKRSLRSPSALAPSSPSPLTLSSGSSELILFIALISIPFFQFYLSKMGIP